MSEQTTATLVADDEALRGIPERTTIAWRDGNAEAFSAEFTDDSRVVIAGYYLQGHEQILGYITKAFAGPVKGTQVISEPVDITYLDQDTAMLITEGGVLVPGETTVAPERALRGTWILSNRNGTWGISAYHSSKMA
jgi:uncharacterized protein (TIGR02246 family)